MNFYKIPDPRRADVTPEEIKELRRVNLLDPSVTAFADIEHWFQEAQWTPMTSGPGKYWSYNPYAWRPDDTAPVQFLMVEGALETADPDWWRTPTGFAGYSLGATVFYRQYASYFPRIPRLTAVHMAPVDAWRMNLYAKPPAMGYPINMRQDFALRFNGDVVEAFSFTEFALNNLSDAQKKVTTPASGGTLKWPEIQQRLFMLFGANMTDEQKAAEFRKIAAM